MKRNTSLLLAALLGLSLSAFGVRAEDKPAAPAKTEAAPTDKAAKPHSHMTEKTMPMPEAKAEDKPAKKKKPNHDHMKEHKQM